VQRIRSQASGPGEEHVAVRQEASRALHRATRHGVTGWLKCGILDHVAHLTQQYLPLREDQRFYWQRTLALMRKLFLLLGERMARAGLLQQDTHIFFLTKDEIEACVQGSDGRAGGRLYAQLAANRQQQFLRLCQDSKIAPERAYPPFLCGDEPWMEEPAKGAVQFQGRGVSPGLAQGRVVTVRSPAEFSKVQRGDVLVATGVDPGWTPLFGLLSALILEHGGQLSHAAVVAREYGLPAVAGIPGIVATLQDGDMVLVDGFGGGVSKIAQ